MKPKSKPPGVDAPVYITVDVAGIRYVTKANIRFTTRAYTDLCRTLSLLDVEEELLTGDEIQIDLHLDCIKTPGYSGGLNVTFKPIV